MAKDKIQKRREALTRARDYLITHVIPNWCKLYQSMDDEDKAMLDQRLVNSAYNARCDRRGELLDHRYYFGSPPGGWGEERAVRFEYAMNSPIYTLEEMHNVIDWASGKSLYLIAYGI